MNKKFILGFLLLGFLFLNPKIEAKIIEKNHNRIITVTESGLNITESKDIKITQSNYFIQAGAEESFIIYNPVFNDLEAESKANKTKESIKVTDNFNNQLQYTTETTQSGNLIVKPRIATGIYGGNTYTITLNYISYGLVQQSGAVRDLYIPGIDKNYVFEDTQSIETINTKVIIPKTLGQINFLKPTIQTTEDGSNYIVNYSQNDLLGITAWIQIGNTQYYSFEIKQEYIASSFLPIVYNRYKIVLPRDIVSGSITQKVYFTEITPKPYSTELDSNGNLLATFKVPVNENGEIKVNGYAVLTQNNTLDFKNSGNLEDIPLEIINKNTSSAKFWEVSANEIQQVANQIKGSEQNVYKIIEKTYKYVVDKIDYSEVKKFGINLRQGALATLNGGAAVCMEYSDLFITLLRAMGVPARAVFGVGYSTLDGLTSSVQTVGHQWAEVYIPSINSWISVDTTWGENGDDIIGGVLNHFFTHVASVNPETPASTEGFLFGKASEFKDKQIKVFATQSTPSVESIDQSTLLNTYPAKDFDNNILETIVSGTSLLVQTINKNINLILKQTPLPKEFYLPVKLIGLVILGFVLYFINRIVKKLLKRIKKKNEAIHPN